MLHLTIPQPCQESWNEMTPVEKGAYCNSCCKTVINFSQMNDREIINYFEQQNGAPTCGRFSRNQLNRPLLYISPEVLLLDMPAWKKFLAVLFICFSTTIVGCGNADETKKDITAFELPPAPLNLPVANKLPIPVEFLDMPEDIIAFTDGKEKECKTKDKPVSISKEWDTMTIGFVYNPHILPGWENQPPAPSIIEKLFGSTAAPK